MLCYPSVQPPPPMPSKGHAFDKFQVNSIYKDDKRKQARAAESAACAKASDNALYKQFCVEIEQSAMDADRKVHACKVVGIACERLLAGENPLQQLRPPPSCAACSGNPHRTHHFLCLKRKLEPGIAEKKVRKSVLAKLGHAWREHQYAQVCFVPIERDAHHPCLNRTRPHQLFVLV